MAACGRSYPLTKGLTGLNRTSASSSKADVQSVRIGVGLMAAFGRKRPFRSVIGVAWRGKIASKNEERFVGGVMKVSVLTLSALVLPMAVSAHHSRAG